METKYYSGKQRKELERFINDRWGGNLITASRDLYPLYCYMQVKIIENQENSTWYFITEGMGAREMNTLFPEYNRIELLMSSTPRMQNAPKDKLQQKLLTVVDELWLLKNYPFSTHSWIVPGQTLKVSEEFKKTFGFDYFLFLECNQTLELSKIGKVRFLRAVPIYEDECNWITNHGSKRFIEAYSNLFDDKNDMFKIDIPRELIIPIE